MSNQPSEKEQSTKTELELKMEQPVKIGQPIKVDQPEPSKQSAPASGFSGWFRTVFRPIESSEEKAEWTWEDSADRARLEQDPIKTRLLFYTICILMLSALVWSTFSEVDQVTRGEGKVIPSQQVQILQSLDGGVITDIFIAEGDIVEKNQLLIRLDATRFKSNLQESRAELLALKVKSIRLKAVVDNTEFLPPENLKEEVPGLIEQELALYESSKEELSVLKNISQDQLTQRKQERIEAIAKKMQADESYRLTKRELELTRPLVKSGAVSEVELLRLERDAASLIGDKAQTEAQIERLKAAIGESEQKAREVELQFKNTIREELSIINARLKGLEESSLGLTDRVDQTALRSPVRGTVKRLFYNTIGGVVLSGKEVIEIIPLDDSLLLETQIKPQDIAFLHPGQQANVKFTAYDFVVYGGLNGKVEHIGADTIMDEKGNPFYIVRVRTTESDLGEGKPIIPGMVASVDIKTGKKTILAYLLKPLLRAKQYALSEQ